MNLEDWYSENFEADLKGRYITLTHINPLLKKHQNTFEISEIGTSELGKKIPLIKIGSGKKIILAWSQMHGNESTTTKAIFDLLNFFSQKKQFQKEVYSFLKNNTLYILPILNPDGAVFYTRKNANLNDLNRDAQQLSQSESVVLMNVFAEVQPDLCLNLHGQRTIFGLENKKPASISFLSPASNKEREVTFARKIAMSHIVTMANMLEDYIPGQIGRYDDSFNSNCFGDCFQMKDVPVILFEAGHLGNDYQREKIREYVFYALLSVLGIRKPNLEATYKDYFSIPENKKNYWDVIIRDVRLVEAGQLTSIAIQFSEILEGETVKFIPILSELGELKDKFAHKEIVGKGDVVLLNTQKIFKIGANVLTIVSENDKSLVYFNVNNLLF